MVEIEKPRITCLDTPEDPSYGKYVVEPLERGYGMTLGNSLRLPGSVGGGAARQHRRQQDQCQYSSHLVFLLKSRICLKTGNMTSIEFFAEQAASEEAPLFGYMVSFQSGPDPGPGNTASWAHTAPPPGPGPPGYTAAYSCRCRPKNKAPHCQRRRCPGSGWAW